MQTLKKILFLFTLTISGLLNTQCSSDDPKPAKEPDVYVAGRFNNKSEGVPYNFIPAYWKNGEMTLLSNENGEAKAIIAINDDVYVIGKTASNDKKILLWKNGVATDFTDGSHYVYIMKMIAVGNDIYAVGFESTINGDIARYWKNGIATTVSSGTGDARGQDIFVNGDDVYVSGYQRNENGIAIAKYWNGGSQEILSDGTQDAIAYGIALSGEDVYVSGEEASTLIYWKNGIQIPLGQEGNSSTGVGSIAIQNSIVYIAGEDNGTAKYWKNDVAFPLTLPEGLSDPYVYSIAKSSKNVYCLGEGAINNSYSTVLWKNGKVLAPFDGSIDAYAYGWCVVE
jgi:hypothetical protein